MDKKQFIFRILSFIQNIVRKLKDAVWQGKGLKYA